MKKYVNFTSKPIFLSAGQRLETLDEAIEQDYDIETNLCEGRSIQDVAKLVAKEVSMKSKGDVNVIIDLPVWLFSLVEKELASHTHIVSISTLAGSRLVRSPMFDYLRSQYELKRLMKKYVEGDSVSSRVNLFNGDTHIDAAVLVRLLGEYTDRVESWKSREADDWDESYQLEGEHLSMDGEMLKARLQREGLDSLAERDVFKF